MSIVYSIIIPHKSTPNLLQRCLDSIPVREDIQTIIVDDDSDPSIVDFEHFPGLEKPNTEVYFDKTGRGAGRARNVGLEHVKGEWLLFADVDDYFYPQAFDLMDEHIGGSDADIFYFLCDSRDGETGELIRDRVPNIRRGIEKKNYDLLRFNSHVPWGKIIHRSLVEQHHIRFEEIECANDVMFSTLIGYYAQTIGVIEKCLYCCTTNKGSLYFNKSDYRNKIRLETVIRVNDFLYQRGVEKNRLSPSDFIFYYFPQQPILFIWALYKGRYKGQPLRYARVIWHRLCRELHKRRVYQSVK